MSLRTHDTGRGAAVHPVLDRLFRQFEEAGLRWCLLRGADDLAAPQGDVDILVAPADLGELGERARACGFSLLPAWGYGTHRFFLCYDFVTDRWIKLDVVTELGFGPGYALRAPVESQCLDRRQLRNGIVVLADADAFWTLLLHELLDNQQPSAEAARVLRLLAPAAAQEDGPLVPFVDHACPPELGAKQLREHVQRGTWDLLAALAPRLLASWGRRQGGSVRLRVLQQRLLRRAGGLLRLWYRPGLSLAVLAPDGAGKSTLVAAMADTFYFPVRGIYMGTYQQAPGRGRGKLPPGVGLAGRLLRQLGRWFSGWRHRARGRLVLFDRYSYDCLLPPRGSQGRLSRLRRWLLAHACPPPDLVVLLDAPGELLHARKGEQSVAVLERERQAYLALLPRLPSPVVIDASRDPVDVRRDVTAVVWDVWSRRWDRRQGPMGSRPRTA